MEYNKTHITLKILLSLRACKILFIFLMRAAFYKIYTAHSISFKTISAEKSKESLPSLNPIIWEAFQKNMLNSSHHSLLYEYAFKHKAIDGLVIAYYAALSTDIYWGDFVGNVCDQNYFKKIASAVKKIMQETYQTKRFCVFIDVNDMTKNVFDVNQFPFRKFYLGDEWLTDIQQFNLKGSKSRNFRYAMHRAKRAKLKLTEIQNKSNLDEINCIIASFAKVKGLSFPRVGASYVKEFVYHPEIHRRIWIAQNSENKIIAIIVACKTGAQQYFFEHAVHDFENLSNYLFDWCFSEILLQLKHEGIQQISWGKVAHLYQETHFIQEPELWLIKKFYQVSRLDQFTKNTITFKKDFSPIQRMPKWAFYSDFRADVLLEITKIIGQ